MGQIGQVNFTSDSKNLVNEADEASYKRKKTYLVDFRRSEGVLKAGETLGKLCDTVPKI